MAKRHLKATVDDRNLFKKFNRIQRQLSKSSLTVVTDLADIGKFRAKEIAPHFTGRTAKMIRAIKRPTADGAKATILSPSPKNYFNTSNSIVNRLYDGNLVKFLHSDDFAATGFRTTGEGKYMFKTADYLNRIKKGIANKIIKGDLKTSIR